MKNEKMIELSVNKFRVNLKCFVDKAIDNSLMNQVAESLGTYQKNSGYKPTQQQLDEINCI